jgi:hypothetical protein
VKNALQINDNFYLKGIFYYILKAESRISSMESSAENKNVLGIQNLITCNDKTAGNVRTTLLGKMRTQTKGEHMLVNG